MMEVVISKRAWCKSEIKPSKIRIPNGKNMFSGRIFWPIRISFKVVNFIGCHEGSIDSSDG